MPPPYPGPFIPGLVTDLVTDAPNDVWSSQMDDVSGQDEACGGVDVPEKWPIDSDDEGYFVPDAVEMKAKLEEAIPPPPYMNRVDQRQHHGRHSHHQPQIHRHQQLHGEDNYCFLLDDAVQNGRIAVLRSCGVSPANSSTHVSPAWRRNRSPETGGSDDSTAPSSNTSGGSLSAAGGGGFTASSSSRRCSPSSLYIPSIASSSLSSQSRLVFTDDPDTTQTSVDYY